MKPDPQAATLDYIIVGAGSAGCVLANRLTASRQAYRDVIAHLVKRGAEGIILGCTEIMLLVRPQDSAVPLFDTTRLHVEAAIARALAGR